MTSSVLPTAVAVKAKTLAETKCTVENCEHPHPQGERDVCFTTVGSAPQVSNDFYPVLDGGPAAEVTVYGDTTDRGTVLFAHISDKEGGELRFSAAALRTAAAMFLTAADMIDNANKAVSR